MDKKEKHIISIIAQIVQNDIHYEQNFMVVKTNVGRYVLLLDSFCQTNRGDIWKRVHTYTNIHLEMRTLNIHLSPEEYYISGIYINKNPELNYWVELDVKLFHVRLKDYTR